MTIRRGALAAGAVATIAAVSAAGGVAGAAGEDPPVATIHASELNGLCFTTEDDLDCAKGDPDLKVKVGDTVRWDFDGAPSDQHNVLGTDGPSDGTWDPAFFSGPLQLNHPPVDYKFTKPGEYTFMCALHGEMKGTITVESTTPPDNGGGEKPPPGNGGGEKPPPGNGGDDDVNTPPPGGGKVVDKTPPRVKSIALKLKGRQLRVNFRLSETGTLTLKLQRKGAKKALVSKRVQVRAGKRAVTLKLRSKLKRGNYSVTIEARDAAGNRSKATKALKVRR